VARGAIVGEWRRLGGGTQLIVPLNVDGYPHHISFSGRVHPSGTNISVIDDRFIDFKEDQGTFAMLARLNVTNAKITVDCYISTLVENYASKALIVVYNVLRARIGLLSFLMGAGTLILIDKRTDVSGETVDIGFGSPELSSLCTSFTATTNYAELQSMAETEPSLGLALDDLILAIALPNHAPVNCARAVEGIRNLIAGDDTPEDVAWPKMREALNVDRAYVQCISNLSKDHRHAKRVIIAEDKQNTALSHSWTLMDRYFHLRLRNLARLPVDEFPILVG
jgi:hypothetical protein